MKILAGSPVRQRPLPLHAHIETMLWQKTEAEVDYLYVNDLDPDSEDYTESSAVLFDSFREQIKVENTPIDRPPGAEYFSGEDTTHWQEATFGYLAQLRNRLIEATLEGGYDYLFMILNAKSRPRPCE